MTGLPSYYRYPSNDETKDYADSNTGGQVNSLHGVAQLG